MLPPPWLIESLPEVDSTNSELMRRARAGLTRPTLLSAQRQSAGRGRLGRQWHSDTGQGLMFSMGLTLNPLSWSGLSLAVGLSVAQSLDPEQHWGLGLKWPNDLWLGPLSQARKLGGILIETVMVEAAPKAARYVVIGVGINIHASPAQGLSMPSVGWAEFQPEATPQSLLAQLALPLLTHVKQFERTGFAPLQAAYAQRDLLRAQALRLSNGVEGVGAGVNEEGVLQIDTSQGRVAVSSDEVSVRLGVAA